MKVQTTLMMTLSASAFLLASCGTNTGTSGITTQNLGQAVKYSKVDINAHPIDKTVCDPFTSIPAVSLDQGIRASLYYLTAGMPLLNKSADYVTKAKKSSQSLFFADMNVPTRLFTAGFASQSNDYLKDDSGNKLIEYFGVKFETIIRLGEGDLEGDYEFALLSDDGTTMSSLSGDLANPTLTTIISNEGDHPTTMGCSSKIIHMSKDTNLPIQLTYYQGPRYHIANILMWRQASVAGKDSLCGASGNNYFFDPDNNSKVLKPYNDLLSRGWKPVAAQNYYVPKDETYNPCVAGTNPVITNFSPIELVMAGGSFKWTTDIPATSQLKITNVATGEIVVTDSDNTLAVNHVVQVDGLKANTAYTAQAVSISEDLGKTISDPINFTTP